MTQANAKRWLKEIEFWSNGGDLWYYENKKWKKYEADSHLVFNTDLAADCVMADIHFEARKAFALAGKILFRHRDETIWVRTSNPSWRENLDYKEDTSIAWYEDERNIGKLFKWEHTGVLAFDQLTNYVAGDNFPVRGLTDNYKASNVFLIDKEDLARNYE